MIVVLRHHHAKGYTNAIMFPPLPLSSALKRALIPRAIWVIAATAAGHFISFPLFPLSLPQMTSLKVNNFLYTFCMLVFTQLASALPLVARDPLSDQNTVEIPSELVRNRRKLSVLSFVYMLT